jgi:hypothetical protein
MSLLNCNCFNWNGFCVVIIKESITLSSRSKALPVFARPNAGIVGSNPTWGTDVCAFIPCLLYCVQVEALRRADPQWRESYGRCVVPLGLRILHLHVVQTGSGVHPAFHPVGIGVFFPGDKAAGSWNWPFIQLAPRSRKVDLYTHSPKRLLFVAQKGNTEKRKNQTRTHENGN